MLMGTPLFPTSKKQGRSIQRQGGPSQFTNFFHAADLLNRLLRTG